MLGSELASSERIFGDHYTCQQDAKERKTQLTLSVASTAGLVLFLPQQASQQITSTLPWPSK